MANTVQNGRAVDVLTALCDARDKDVAEGGERSKRWTYNPYAYHSRLYKFTLISSGGLLYAPPTYKEYRGHIMLGFERLAGFDRPALIGVCTYGRHDGDQVGKLNYSNSVDHLLKVVNKQLASKLRKGYEHASDVQPLLDPDRVWAAIDELLS